MMRLQGRPALPPFSLSPSCPRSLNPNAPPLQHTPPQDSVSRIEQFRAEVAGERKARGRRRQTSTLTSLTEDEHDAGAVDVDASPPDTPTQPIRRRRLVNARLLSASRRPPCRSTHHAFVLSLQPSQLPQQQRLYRVPSGGVLRRPDDGRPAFGPGEEGVPPWAPLSAASAGPDWQRSEPIPFPLAPLSTLASASALLFRACGA